MDFQVFNRRHHLRLVAGWADLACLALGHSRVHVAPLARLALVRSLVRLARLRLVRSRVRLARLALVRSRVRLARLRLVRSRMGLARLALVRSRVRPACPAPGCSRVRLAHLKPQALVRGRARCQPRRTADPLL